MKNVLITGSSTGIGLSIARLLANKGYRVFQTGRRKMPKETCRHYYSIDLNSFAAADELYDNVQKSCDGIDILINNAGEYLYSSVEKTTTSDISRLTMLNFEIPFYLTKLVAPHMKKQKSGRIVNVASISAVVGESDASLYAATKAALFGMTKSLALEFAYDCITINSISPGWVDTNLANNALSDDEKKETLDIIPQRRFISPDEIAKLVLYLISDDAKGLTGQNINLCAGLSVGC